MPEQSRDDLLREHTFKGELPLRKRVSQTMRDRRYAPFLGVLVELLHAKGVLSEEEIDELLLAAWRADPGI